MAGGGGYVGPGGDGSSNGGHPQGTEYTLQGGYRVIDLDGREERLIAFSVRF